MITRIRIKTVLAGLSILTFSFGLFGDVWYNNYEKAKRAAEEKKWEEVIHYINVALEDKSEPRYNAKTYGLNFVNYFPYYYLGLAHYGSGRYKEAQEAFERSLNFGDIKKANEFDSLKRMLEECKEKLKPVPPKQEVPAVTLKPAGKEDKTEKPSTKPEKKKETVSKPEKKEPETQASTPVVEKKKEEKSETPNPWLVEGIGDLNLGIEYYFNGKRGESEQYLKKSIRLFSEVPGVKEPLIYAYGFLAVVLIENYCLGGESSEELLKEAGVYIREIRKLDPGFRLEETYFSPKIIEFFSR
jgi:tetratricopeptide (TPR) repeat protein